jgi:hypothetical protein
MIDLQRPDPRPRPGEHRRVEPLTLHDPEHDPPQFRNAANARPPFLPQEYQRLVANPFLALFGLVVWFAAFWGALASRNLILAGVAIPGLIVVGYLLQYHCLDCGTTGLLFRWKSHSCDRVLARQQAGRVRRFRGPNPTFQTILWAYLVAAVTILVAVVLMASRA